MDMSPELLRVSRLRKTFYGGPDPKTVLDDINFTLSAHDSLAVVGPSGCGKTTLLLIIAGLLPPSEGAILLEGAGVKGAAKNVGLVLQHYGLFPWKSVAANIALGAKLQKRKVTDDELRGIKKDLGIEGLDHLYPAQLSGGERQRVALARAILLRPSLLLLDEPFAAIDTITRERLQTGLLEVFKQRRFSFIIVTHSFDEAVFLGRKLLVLDNGKGIRAMLDNEKAGDPAFRSTPEFFERTVELRRILEGSL
jgi:NitT/TauT family transport system ATP-binding protein